MPLRHLARVAFHLLLALMLALPAAAAPAQGVHDALQTASAAATDDMPCDDMGMPEHDSKPCDCCTPHQCDFSACLGVACLPELQRVVAHIPPAKAPSAWRHVAAAPRPLETPFRPPIA